MIWLMRSVSLSSEVLINSQWKLNWCFFWVWHYSELVCFYNSWFYSLGSVNKCFLDISSYVYVLFFDFQSLSRIIVMANVLFLTVISILHFLLFMIKHWSVMFLSLIRLIDSTERVLNRVNSQISLMALIIVQVFLFRLNWSFYMILIVFTIFWRLAIRIYFVLCLTKSHYLIIHLIIYSCINSIGIVNIIMFDIFIMIIMCILY